jgi:osmotically-inducible protein OsmY
MAAGFALLCVVVTPILLAQKTPPREEPKSEQKAAATLSREIRHQLLVLPYYSVFDFLTYTVDGSRVTLSGQVLRPTLKTAVESAVKTLEGVDSVTNRIEVLAPSPTDDDLRRSVYRAIYEDVILARYAAETNPPIHIIVKDGNVTLEGSVENAGHKNLAELRTKAVENILSVKNNLVTQPRGNEAE